jgi:hypothetical protein
MLDLPVGVKELFLTLLTLSCKVSRRKRDKYTATVCIRNHEVPFFGSTFLQACEFHATLQLPSAYTLNPQHYE